MAQTKPGRMKAERTMRLIIGPSAQRRDVAEAALAAGEILERFDELGLAEVGPELGGEKDLGVGRLPQKEIREPQLAAGADYQVWIRQARCLEQAGKCRFVQLFGSQLPLLQQARGLD